MLLHYTSQCRFSLLFLLVRAKHEASLAGERRKQPRAHSNSQQHSKQAALTRVGKIESHPHFKYVKFIEIIESRPPPIDSHPFLRQPCTLADCSSNQIGPHYHFDVNDLVRHGVV